jgi:hypothetical protein
VSSAGGIAHHDGIAQHPVFLGNSNGGWPMSGKCSPLLLMQSGLSGLTVLSHVPRIQHAKWDCWLQLTPTLRTCALCVAAASCLMSCMNHHLPPHQQHTPRQWQLNPLPGLLGQQIRPRL